MDLREILKEAYKFMLENRSVLSQGGHLSTLFPKVDVVREPGETVVFKSVNNQLYRVKPNKVINIESVRQKCQGVIK